MLAYLNERGWGNSEDIILLTFDFGEFFFKSHRPLIRGEELCDNYIFFARTNTLECEEVNVSNAMDYMMISTI